MSELAELLSKLYPPICNKESILSDLDESQVVSFELDHDKKRLLVREECDGYHQLVLDKDETEKLIHELMALYEQMSD